MITLVQVLRTDAGIAAIARKVIEDVVAEHEAALRCR